MELKEWRPLCLLNVDLKLITKMIANRLKTKIASIISPRQTGYVPGRFIGTNLRKLVDLLGYIEKEHISAVLITVDFEKCFDSISHDALSGALRYFNIGEYIISWIQLVYKGFKLCVTNNGYLSEYFIQERGVHQGCGLSGPAFLYCAELMAERITSNTRIQGIKIGEDVELLSQYADDTSIVTLYSQDSIEAIIEEFDSLYKNTGLKVNYDKTVIYPVGAAQNKRQRMYLSRKFKWSHSTIDILGLLINIGDLDDKANVNMDKVIQKATNILQSWQKRCSSLQGKITVINALVASLFVYLMQILPTINHEVESTINRLITSYIWNGRKPKIKLEYLTQEKASGGRKLVNILAHDKALKLQWIPRLITGDHVLTTLAFYHMNVKIKNELIWECNFSKKDVKQFKCNNKFWESVLMAWAEYNFNHPNTVQEYANQVIWYNTHIRVADKMIWYEWAYNLGLMYVKDLYMNNVMLTYVECGGDIKNIMEYNSLIAAIPMKWKKALSSAADEVHEMEHSSKYGQLIEKSKWAPIVYIEMRKSDISLIRIMKCLNDTYGLLLAIEDVRKAGMIINKACKMPKFQSLQYRLLHNAVILNDRLVHCHIVDSNLCTLRKIFKETPNHFFLECNVSKKIYADVTEYIAKEINEPVKIGDVEIITGIIPENESKWLCRTLALMVTKQKLYATRCQKKQLRAAEVINEIAFIRKQEKKLAMCTKNCKRYNSTWPDGIFPEKVESVNAAQVILKHIDHIKTP